MKKRSIPLAPWRALLALGAAAFIASPAPAQFLAEQNAAMGVNDSLNGGSTGSASSGVGGLALSRARGVTGAQNGAFGGAQPGFGGVNTPGLTGIPGIPGLPALPGQAAIPAVPISKANYISVLTGTRVYDAISGSLIDDAQEMLVPATEKDKFFDDGTHGDVEAGDGRYTKVDERRDALGLGNERVKERLVQAVLKADELSPLQFYGFTLMTTENRDLSARHHQWKLVPDPKGGPGMVLAEVPVDEAVTVPNYRTYVEQKDDKVKNDWASRFLQEYRINKDNLTSEFYPAYVPVPPPIPNDAPPLGWQPFSDPGSLLRQQQMQAQQLQQFGPLGASPYGALPGGGIGNAGTEFNNSTYGPNGTLQNGSGFNSGGGGLRY